MSIEDNKDLNGAWRDMENLSHTTTKKKEKMGVGFLRQWLNEDRITDPKKMVTNEELLVWIDDVTQKPLKEGGELVTHSTVLHTPDSATLSINDIVKEFEERFLGTRSITADKEATDFLRATLTSFQEQSYHDGITQGEDTCEKEIHPHLIQKARQSIYKELIDAIEGEKIECADTATAQIRNDTLEKLKKRICA